MMYLKLSQNLILQRTLLNDGGEEGGGGLNESSIR